MKRSGIVRLQLVLLLVLAGLLVWRVTGGPGRPEAAVALVDVSLGELDAEGFGLERDGRVRIEATGSILEPGDPTWAAYPWILRLDDRSVAWSFAPDSLDADRTLQTAVDTVTLRAGAYTVYYTTFGPTARARSGGSFLGLRRYWTNDEGSWQFVLSTVDSIAVEPLTDSDTVSSAEPAAVWTSGPVGNRSNREGLFVVNEPTSIRVTAVAELCSTRCDDAMIEDAVSHRTIWALSGAETEPAGGMIENRRFDGSVDLPAGIYRARFTTDGSHAYGAWRANPPWDPESWGLTVAAPSGTVSAFDPWEDAEPLVAMLQVGDDEVRRTSIEVERRARIVVDATGEISTGGNRYDYAWIEREDRSRVWEMELDRTGPAGGDVTNRREIAFLDLEPGRYVVYYQSDGSHAYGDWRRTRPTHPERWGVAVFPMATGKGDSLSVRVVDDVPKPPEPPDVGGIVPPDMAPLPPVAGETIFSAVGLGNDENRTGTFELSRTTRIRIIALGEIDGSQRYDYGWIESATGEFVWEMTVKNTKQVGGDASNRLFDDVVTLPAGRYVAHFHTDFSHANGDFGDSPPPDPAAWGMRIIRMPE